ncbi:MAG TPA: zinc-binding dehydrogenase [Solirubrobacteraceae bacterium]|jgi:NADPH2:quinone reductase
MPTMRAIQMSEFGGPEVLKLAELAIPTPGEDEVLIRVARAGVNFADTHTRTNSYVRKATLPLVPGGEVAGTIERAPADSGLEPGARVVALTGTGGYAQYAMAPAAHAFEIPAGVDDGTALALIVQGTTAWHLYRTAGRVAAGESVVVHSAAGGVGSLATQLGHALGAGRVIGTASSEKRRELAVSLGADVAVDPAPEGLSERLIEANGGEPVDVVFDMAGGETFDASYEALSHFGRIVVCGISGEEPNSVSTGSLLRHSRAVVGFYLFHCLRRPGMFGEALADLFARVVSGELRAVLGGTYPLAEAARAQIDLRERRTTGKLLLDPGA